MVFFRKLIADRVEPVYFSVKVTSAEIAEQPKRYQNRTEGLTAKFAEIFECNARTIEMLPADTVQNFFFNISQKKKLFFSLCI